MLRVYPTYSVLGLQQSTLAGHLAAVQSFHRLSCSGELDTGHPLICNALKGVARGHADVGTQQRVRQPVRWGVLKAGGKLVPAWGSGGRVLFLVLCASFFFLTRSSEMFAVSRSAMHEVHGLRRGDVAFFQGPEQLPSARWECADRVELRFRFSKDDQFRKGTVVTRVRVGPRCRSEAGGGAVDVMIDLLSCCRALPSHAPLVAFDVEGGRWSMWSKHQAVAALRQVVALAGLPPMEYALHSLRIGGATYLAAAGATPEVLRKEGRWAGEEGYRPYVRSHGGDAAWVSKALASEGGGAVQSGQGT
ncbi:unnamed protein product, partial [Pylaiella littoralis]